jgi:hypothetical protein
MILVFARIDDGFLRTEIATAVTALHTIFRIHHLRFVVFYDIYTL